MLPLVLLLLLSAQLDSDSRRCSSRSPHSLQSVTSSMTSSRCSLAVSSAATGNKYLSPTCDVSWRQSRNNNSSSSSCTCRSLLTGLLPAVAECRRSRRRHCTAAQSVSRRACDRKSMSRDPSSIMSSRDAVKSSATWSSKMATCGDDRLSFGWCCRNVASCVKSSCVLTGDCDERHLLELDWTGAASTEADQSNISLKKLTYANANVKEHEIQNHATQSITLVKLFRSYSVVLCLINFNF